MLVSSWVLPAVWVAILILAHIRWIDLLCNDTLAAYWANNSTLFLASKALLILSLLLGALLFYTPWAILISSAAFLAHGFIVVKK